MSLFTLINLSTVQEFRGADTYERNAVGVLYLVSALEAKGFQVDFQEYLLHHELPVEEEWRGFLEMAAQAQGWLGISCHSIHLPFAVVAAQRVKAARPDLKVVLGGIGPTSVAEELIRAFDWLDAVLRLEGEEVLPRLLRGEDPATLPGVCARVDGQVVMGPPPRRIVDLDSLPLPAYDRLDFSAYRVLSIIGARGCPYNCSFCSVRATWGPQVTWRSTDRIIDELRMIHGKGVREVWFEDPTFVLRKQRVIEFCRALEEARLEGFRFRIFGRVNLMDQELMEALVSAGCFHVFYGLETGSLRLINEVKPAVSLDQALDCIALSQRHFDTVNVGLMWGFPGETFEDFQDTVDLKARLENDHGCLVAFNWLYPYRGSRVCEEHLDDLFFPEGSLMARPNQAFSQAQRLLERPAQHSLSSIRSMLAGAQMLTGAEEVIRAHPRIFSDYYRLRTPDLERKLAFIGEDGAY